MFAVTVFTCEILDFMRQVKTLATAEAHFPEARTQYSMVNKQVRKNIKKGKDEWIEDICQEFEQAGRGKMLSI